MEEIKKKNIVAFYHRGDLDGVSSGAIFNRIFSEHNLKLVGIEFGDILNIDEIIKDADIVYMADFVLEPFSEMIKLNKKCKFIWIDHHISSLRYVSEHPKSKFLGVLGNEKNMKSAAYLLWEYFYPSITPPYVIQQISLFDTWQHNFNDDILNFYYGVESESGMSPYSNVWNDLFTVPYSDSVTSKEMMHTGKLIRKYIKQKDAIYALEHAFETEFDGYKAIAINVGFANSMKFDAVWNDKKYDIMIGFSRKKNHHWKFSLYSTKNHIDCSAISKKYGGGGHKSAAGFEYKTLPFEL
jgi:oligoribonuclease NrnB/cAMP/cGMP phosphodiesterase (DHH superfamily)